MFETESLLDDDLFRSVLHIRMWIEFFARLRRKYFGEIIFFQNISKIAANCMGDFLYFIYLFHKLIYKSEIYQNAVIRLAK
jgi:hypothetical protein